MAYTHILAPTDFSAPAQHALCNALEEATHHQAQLTLLHVLHPHHTTDVHYIKGAPENRQGYGVYAGGTLPLPALPPMETVRRDYIEEATVQLRDLIPDSFTSPWHVRVATGDPADAIVRMAQEIGADLIIMGTHGRTGLPHILLGSVAEKVVRHAFCPVLTIKHSQPVAPTAASCMLSGKA